MRRLAPIFVVFLVSCVMTGVSTHEPTLVITDVTVIDATGAPPRPHMNVVIDAERIAEITSRRLKSAPHVIDGSGKYLIPGLWDMHTHLSFHGDDVLAMHVRNGVLAVRDLGGTLEELTRWRDEIDRGARIGPHIFRAGPYLDGPKEFDDDVNGRLRKATTITITTPEEGRAAVDSLKARGVDTIKTHNTLSKASFLAIVDESHRVGLPIAVHLPSPTTTIEEASDAGVTSLEHIEMLTESISYADLPPGGKPKSPLVALDQLTDDYAMNLFHRFARNHTAYDPTLVGYRTFMQEAVDNVKKDPRWQKAVDGRTKMFHRFIALVGLMKRAGVTVVTGTDSGIRPETVPYPISIPGSDLHDEMKLFVEGGFTPMEALQSATSDPARVMGVADRMGTIEVGKEASLVLLDRDPLADITNTRSISTVIFRGRVVELPLEKPPGLVGEGTPEVPAQLARDVARYTGKPFAELLAWHPSQRAMLINTRSGEAMQVHRVDAPGGARAQLTFFNDDVTQDVAYDASGATIVFSKDQDGDGNDQIYTIDSKSGAIARVTDSKSRNRSALWANTTHRIVYTSTRRNGKDADLYLIDPADPPSDRLLAQVNGPGWTPLDWSPDDTRILVRQMVSETDNTLWIVDAKSGAMARVGAGVFGAFGYDGKIIMVSDAASEMRELVTDGRRLSQHIPWDVIELALSPDRRRAAIVTNEAGVFTLHVIDVESGREVTLPKLPPGYVTGIHWHRDGQTLGFNLDSARTPTDVYSLDVMSGTIERWTSGVDELAFAEPQVIEWKSFDGRTISGFLYMPPPRFTGKRPVLIDFHGGPEEEFTPYFLGRWNYLLDELGVALVCPNVRGSSGFGKTFLALDDGTKREDSLRDVGALLDWIAAQPQLDATRVATFGVSYGGFMSLSTATHYGDRIRAAIDVAGPTNLVSFLEKTAEWRRDLRRVEYGDERDPATRQFLDSISPLTHADKITKPLFVVQGANDPAVPLSEAAQIVERVKKNGTPVWYLLGNDEGHGFRKKSNVAYQFALMVMFLRQYLLQ